MAAPVIQFKRGQFANLPGLRAGEPGFTTDKYDLYVGINSTTDSNKFFGSHRYWNRETGSTGSGVRLVEGTSGDQFIELKAPAAIGAAVTYTFPAAAVNNGFLRVDSAGNLSWDDTLDAIGVNVLGVGTIAYLQSTTINVAAGVTVGGDLDVDGNATFAGITTLTQTETGDLVVSAGATITGDLNLNDNLVGDGDTNISGINSVTATTFYGDASGLTGISTTGNQIEMGAPTDGDLTDGAIEFTEQTTVTDGIDELNELSLNIIKNAVVADVSFTSTPTSGPNTLDVQLTITSAGNADRYDIVWGDGNSDIGITSSMPTHTYNEPTGGTFTIAVTARASAGTGAGSSQTFTRTDYITVYTAAPGVAFVLYRASSGGSALTGNDLWVRETQDLYLDNTTTNATGVGATYTVNWGDGNVVGVASDTDAGGSNGARLQHTWAEGTSSGTGLDTVTLTIEQHNTTDPAVIPSSSSLSLKVYDNSPADPAGLSSKTLANVTGVGSLPKLVSGADDNTGGTGLSAGDDVVRVISGIATAGPIDSFAYNGDSGTLSAAVNGSTDGSKGMTSADDSGTYTSLVITEESDYNLLTSAGVSTDFEFSTYYPGLYKGFKASVAKAVADMSVGVNKYRLQHTDTGNTNEVEFVVDKDVTDAPTSNVGGATLAENTGGTKRFISGIPYYNSGSPDLTLSGVTISNLTGQTYSDVSNPVEVDDGTNQESTTDGAITDSDYTYANIDGSSTMLSGGIPTKNVGVSSPYAIGSLTVPVTSDSVRTVSRARVRSRNSNGVGSYSELSTNIQVHTAAQSNISEIAIAVADALGSGFDDDGVRIFDFATETTDNPAIPGSVNFYTNNIYTESADPGISTTREAVLRLGNIQHNQVDYSSGYLPVGPDLSSGRSGTQYFTFAFRRETVANFNISITSATGIAGLWIAAPGTDIDNTSGLNGWLAADTAYAGSGIPGSDTGNGGNGSDGCALTTGDRIIASTALSGSYTLTLGSENLSNATNNVALIRIGLADGDSITALSIS